MLLVVIGVQLITMGLLAEMVIRTYHESQAKPIYYVRNVVAWPRQRVVTVPRPISNIPNDLNRPA